MQDERSKIAFEIIHWNFEIELSDDKNNFHFRKMLIDKIDFLLHHDFHKLMAILYRIDVNEEKTRNALRSGTEQNPAIQLADLIIERQLEKARTRKVYGDQSAGDDSNPELFNQRQ